MAKEVAEDKAYEYDVYSEAKTGLRDGGGYGEPMEKPEVGSRPPTGLLRGYTQTYLVRKPPGEAGGGDEKEDDSCEHEVLFRCGNWCYTGHVVLSRRLSLREVPVAIPLLQRQQSRLHYYCNASAIPEQSYFSAPIKYSYEVAEFTAGALSTEAIALDLEDLAKDNPWIEGGNSMETFFQLRAENPECMDDIVLLASKTYARGLIFVTVWYEGVFYMSMSDGEGDQPLLDVRFPDVSHHGEGVELFSAHPGTPKWFRSLSLWHCMPRTVRLTPPPTRNLTTDSYMQMYMVLRPRPENGGFSVTSAYREVLFRFGSWCYGGSVQLTPGIQLADIPHVIPALRLQQSRLEYVYSADAVPSTSPYAKPMAFMMQRMAAMEQEIAGAEEVLGSLVDRLTAMGLGESISSWLEGDASQSFFEFQMNPTSDEMRALKSVELIANKCYFASGVVLITIFFEGTLYAVLADAGKEQPLLDSKFPDVSSKGRGYQIRAYAEGLDHWPSLRKVAVWQTTSSMQREMEDRLTKIARAREAGGHAAADTVAAAEQRAAKEADEALHRDEEEEGIGAVATSDRGAERAESQRHPAASHEPSAFEAMHASAKGTADPDEEGISAARVEEKMGSKGGDERDRESAAASTRASPLAQSKSSDRQSLGAFHRLAPLRGGMQNKLEELRSQMGSSGGAAPWDASGRPLGKPSFSPSKNPFEAKQASE
mmetsp:Transcript_18242/g.53310  ORF Transcript_18242/g.53310 Transcript_18242/m.53310 type:complete len:709 (-) Transcript_18242:517-2643(-)|eukprot:CAMPEP_0118981046 /NCGR_PEP_ID=MMETSP1173-20130426/29721_1 /TAXON_ID=1034831 /ORGANISM="Rhizochromulina marina cf, Strain CCMP1243" /LENGTH=708 /DNA_ID=CAMNT_0006931439 /DNA_START=55 /DNA_END=2181 /DNA_ORIENTATION=+